MVQFIPTQHPINRKCHQTCDQNLQVCSVLIKINGKRFVGSQWTDGRTLGCETDRRRRQRTDKTAKLTRCTRTRRAPKFEFVPFCKSGLPNYWNSCNFPQTVGWRYLIGYCFCALFIVFPNLGLLSYICTISKLANTCCQGYLPTYGIS